MAVYTVLLLMAFLNIRVKGQAILTVIEVSLVRVHFIRVSVSNHDVKWECINIPIYMCMSLYIHLEVQFHELALIPIYYMTIISYYYVHAVYTQLVLLA